MPASSGTPLVDIRARWRAGQVALAAAALLTLVAALRPLAPGASPRVRLAVTLALGLGVAASALLTSLRGRGAAETVALYAFLVLSMDAFGQMLVPLGWPVWPLMALVVAGVAVAEAPAIAGGVAALAALLSVFEVAHGGFLDWKDAVASSLGYAALALAVHHAQNMDKSRLGAARAEVARLRHGIDSLDMSDPASAPARPGQAAAALRQASEEGRHALRIERAGELDERLGRVAALARASVHAHAVAYFDFDRANDRAHVRGAAGPPALLTDAAVPLRADPFAFVVDRGQSFYATDFKKLLFCLPWYRGEVKVGTLLAVPVRHGDVVRGALVADRLEIQAFTGEEPALLHAFADLVADSIHASAASTRREETSVQADAIYAVSRQMADLTDAGAMRQRLLACARNLCAVEGGAVVIIDPDRTRYSVTNSVGWMQEFEGREVALVERTWTTHGLRQESASLLDDLKGQQERLPVLVLDEGTGRAEALLMVPIRLPEVMLGAVVLAGRRGAFDSAAQHVLSVLANQAAGALRAWELKGQAESTAMKDGLTGLFNRRAFDQEIEKAIAREERQKGTLSLLLLDIDHFKKLNDTFGHPAGDAALRNTTQLLKRHLRKSDHAARFGGEEFAVILPGTAEAGARLLAERIRAEVEKGHIIFEGARLSVTVSLGLAVWPRDGASAEDLVSAADRALYAAKQAGRNRVVVAGGLRDLPL